VVSKYWKQTIQRCGNISQENTVKNLHSQRILKSSTSREGENERSVGLVKQTSLLERESVNNWGTSGGKSVISQEHTDGGVKNNPVDFQNQT
jgi:hypothetical protein